MPGLSAWAAACPSCERRSVTRRRATQSSSLYLSIRSFHSMDRVLSHESRQQTHCNPEASSEVQVAPTNLPTSLSPFDRTGKYTFPKMCEVTLTIRAATSSQGNWCFFPALSIALRSYEP